MKPKTAYKIAIEAIKKQQRPFAVGANLYKQGVKIYSTEKEFKKHKRLEEAIEILRQELDKKDVKQTT